MLYPVPAVMVTCKREGGQPNIITIAWAGTVCSSPAMVSISVRPERYSYDIIKASGEFVINLVTEKLTFATDYCGVKSGRDIDKFKATGLHTCPGLTVATPGIAESPVNIECRVKEIISLGSHDMFIADVVNVKADDKYLNKEEQIIWFRGDNAAFSGMNGIEQNDKLDKLEAKFGEWYNRSQYEVICEVIRQFTSQKGDTVYANRLNELKETVYTNHLSGKDSCGDAGIDDVCALFDKVGQTNYYSELYKAHAKAMDNMCEQKIKIAEVFYHAIQFELTMPGTLLSSNASLSTNNIMVWKIDGLRLLTGNYVLTAESRVINYWAFGLTLLIILATLGIFIKLYRNR